MESTDTPRSALDEIKTVSFKQGIRGYVVDEVDEFLDRAAAEVDQIREQMHQLRQQLRQAGERIRQLEGGAPVVVPAPAPVVVPTPAPVPAPAPVAPPAAVSAPVASHTAGAEQVTAMIAMAQQFIEQAQQEAEASARELTVAAQDRAREIVAEARSRAEDEVTRLNGLKQRLSEDVVMLTRQLDAERTRLSSVLAELSQWIESSLHMGVEEGAHVAPRGAAPAPSAAPTTQSDVSPRPVAPPPAPPATVGQVLNFESPGDNRA
ncbi:MAG TPA: DivIVA domain-containing protein [Acidimicrobiales bacterium]